MGVILACISDLCHRSADNVTTRISTVPCSPVAAIFRHFLYDLPSQDGAAPAAFLARPDAVRPASSGSAPAALRYRPGTAPAPRRPRAERPSRMRTISGTAPAGAAAG